MKKLLSLLLIGIMMLSSISVFAVEKEKNIEIYSNGALIELVNKPFVENDVIYLPLRELFEKIGIVDNKDSYINWDNGKIEIMAIENADNRDLAYHYGIEIDKAEYVLNPGYEEMYQTKWRFSNIKQMNAAPLLRDGKTYIPYEYVESLINKHMRYTKVEIVNAE